MKRIATGLAMVFVHVLSTVLLWKLRLSLVVSEPVPEEMLKALAIELGSASRISLLVMVPQALAEPFRIRICTPLPVVSRMVLPSINMLLMVGVFPAPPVPSETRRMPPLQPLQPDLATPVVPMVLA